MALQNPEFVFLRKYLPHTRNKPTTLSKSIRYFPLQEHRITSKTSQANTNLHIHKMTTPNPQTTDEEINPTAFTALYFAFASNISPRTLQSRCPGSLYVGLAVLKGYKFLISSLGFGNVVHTGNNADEVFGSLYFLTRQNEKAMDEAEMHVLGEGRWHDKIHVEVMRMEKKSYSEVDGELQELGAVQAMTYIDTTHTSAGVASKENLTFLRRAVDDGIECGIPRSYFEGSWKRFLPEDEGAGRQEEMTMVRTSKMNQGEVGRYVPKDVLRMAGEG